MTGAAAWHINADEPSYLSYDEDFKPLSLIPILYAPDPYRACDQAIDAMRGLSNKDTPFFLYYPMILTHDPFQPTPDSPDWDRAAPGESVRRRQQHFADMVAYTDKIVGRLVAALAELDGDLCVAGSFAAARELPAANIVRWNHRDGSGSLGSGTAREVLALGAFQGDLIVGGRFDTAGGRKSANMARWTP